MLQPACGEQPEWQLATAEHAPFSAACCRCTDLPAASAVLPLDSRRILEPTVTALLTTLSSAAAALSAAAPVKPGQPLDMCRVSESASSAQDSTAVLPYHILTCIIDMGS